MQPERAKPRLADVAHRAGVSLGSASRALAQPDKVKPKTLAAVRAAAAELGYIPDAAARALARGRTTTLGLLVPTLANPIFATFTQAAQRACAARDHQLVVTSDEYEREQSRRNVLQLIEHGVAGLILVGAEHHGDVAEHLARNGLPHVFTWSFDEARGRGCVGISNRGAAWAMVRHLLDLGHRRFATLSGDPAHNERARSRLEAVRGALQIAGCPLAEEATVFCPFSIHAGREGMTRLLSLPTRPTAVICNTDLLAAGALAEAKARGLHVPDELSITGFDDVDFASLLDPPLTTIRVPAALMGERAVRALIGSLSDHAPIPDIELPADLILRGSTAPPPEARRR